MVRIIVLLIFSFSTFSGLSIAAQKNKFVQKKIYSLKNDEIDLSIFNKLDNKIEKVLNTVCFKNKILIKSSKSLLSKLRLNNIVDKKKSHIKNSLTEKLRGEFSNQNSFDFSIYYLGYGVKKRSFEITVRHKKTGTNLRLLFNYKCTLSEISPSIKNHKRWIRFKVNRKNLNRMIVDKYLYERVKPLSSIYGACVTNNQNSHNLLIVSKLKRQINRLVGFIDTGIDYNHTNLAFRVRNKDGSSRLLDLSNDPDNKKLKGYDIYGHGTTAADIMTSKDNRLGLYPVKFYFEDNTKKNRKNLYNALSRLYKAGVRTFGDSSGITYGTNDNGKNFVNVIKEFVEKHPDVLYVAAAGNRGRPVSKSSLCGKSERVLCIGAVNSNGKITNYSNFHQKRVQLAAYEAKRGYSVPGGGFTKEISKGTSFTQPQVTATIESIRAINPSLSPKEIIHILKSTSIKKPNLKGYFAWSSILNHKNAISMTCKLSKVSHRLCKQVN